MLDPKIFHRKLDSILAKIGLEKSGKDFLFSIMNALEKTFSDDLHLGGGRIYEERGTDYVLISPASEKSKLLTLNIPASSDAFQALLKTKTYIFDNPALSIDRTISNQKEYKIPVAILIRSSDNSWIFVFELKSGWVREEIELCLNAVRTVLNYRFVSEAAKNEVEQAAHIQQSLLPAIPPEFPGLKIAGRSQPAELVGGDLYDYFNFEDDVLGVCIGDASGHGLPAALLVRDVVTGLRMGLEKHMKMVYTFKKLNKVIYQSVYSTRFISLFYAEIERNGELLFVNAGHPSPLLFDGQKFTELESTGLIFGALPDIQLSRGYAMMKPGNVLVLYTDGIIERKNSSLEDFTLEKLMEVITNNYNRPPSEILDAIFSTSNNFGDKTDWEDDATVVVIKRES
jgi:sigma-B regulation protein RsbU (phosphoserine phosphatase)